MPKRLLILGGTTESAQLAHLIGELLADRVDVVTSLAGRVTPVADLPGRVRVGGFGGISGLCDYLRREAMDLVIDATHPFAENISAHAYAACVRADVPRLMVSRPPWTRPPGSRWLEVADLSAAARVLPDFSRRAFLTVGQGGMEAFSTVEDVWFLVRLLAEPEEPLSLAADHVVVTGRPPFSIDEERRVMEDHHVDTLVTKNSGGKAGEAKIIAAAALGLRLLVAARPLPEPGLSVESVQEAVAWLNSRL